MKCACGCGKEISNQKAKKGGKFLNRKHSAAYMAKMRKGKKLGPYRKRKEISSIDDKHIDYTHGPVFCSSYDNDNIKCVMCFENNISCPEECPLKKN